MSIAQGIDIRLLTPQEAAKILNVHENTLRRWCDQGILKAYRIGSSAHRRIPLDQVRTLSTQMRENRGYFGRLSCFVVGWSLFGLLPSECAAFVLVLLAYYQFWLRRRGVGTLRSVLPKVSARIELTAPEKRQAGRY